MLKDLLLEPRLDTLREREGGEREERGGEEREGGERGGGVNYYLAIHYVHVFLWHPYHTQETEVQ